MQYSFEQYSIENYQTKIVGKIHNNSNSIKSHSKTNIITDKVMIYSGSYNQWIPCIEMPYSNLLRLLNTRGIPIKQEISKICQAQYQDSS